MLLAILDIDIKELKEFCREERGHACDHCPWYDTDSCSEYLKKLLKK